MHAGSPFTIYVYTISFHTIPYHTIPKEGVNTSFPSGQTYWLRGRRRVGLGCSEFVPAMIPFSFSKPRERHLFPAPNRVSARAAPVSLRVVSAVARTCSVEALPKYPCHTMGDLTAVFQCPCYVQAGTFRLCVEKRKVHARREKDAPIKPEQLPTPRSVCLIAQVVE